MVISVNSSAKNLGLGGKIVGTLFFSVFLLMGLFFEVMIVKQTAKNLTTFSWAQTEATILASETHPPRHRDDDPTFHVRYTYVAGGAQHESTRYDRDAEAPATHDAYQLAARYTPGTPVPCWVNPQDHTEAILQRKSPLQAFVVLFPLIFIAIGGGGIWAMWFWRKKNAVDNKDVPISSKPATTGSNRLILIAAFGLFLSIGLGVGYGFFIHPLIQISAARNWTATPCEILTSRVKTHSGDDGSTYSVDVVYRYTYQNRTYTANRYNFFTGSSSGYEGKAAAVQQYPAGSQRTCYVDPAEPSSAVLSRSFSSMLWFGLIPLVFAIMGAVGLYNTLFKKTKISAPFTKDFYTAAMRTSGAEDLPVTESAPSPRTLAPGTSPKAKLVGLILVALFWNSIVSVFLFNQTWSGIGLFMALFLVPFVAIGIGLIGGVFYQAMALFNPRPLITVSQGVAHPGDALDVRWEFTGRTDRLTRLQLSLEGREEATYRRGTDTVTDKETFARIQLLDTTDLIALHAGSARLQIPASAMHSFKAPNNKIVWALKLHGNIPRWPDVKEEFPFEISPGGSSS